MTSGRKSLVLSKKLLMLTAAHFMIAPIVFADGIFDQVDGASVCKTAFNGAYDALLKDQTHKSARAIKEHVVVKLKQVLWRAGDLAALQNDGTFIPVVHQYRSLADWALSFVLGAQARTAINCGVQAATWMYDLESALGEALEKKFGVSSVDGFINQIADVFVKRLTGTAIDAAFAPVEPTTALTRGQKRTLECELSTQEGRAKQLSESFEEWGIQDWVEHIMFNLGQKANEQGEYIIDYLQAELMNAFFKQEGALLNTAATFTSGALVATVTANPWAAAGAGYAVSRLQPTVPDVLLQRQRAKFEAVLQDIRDGNYTLVKVTANDIEKHHNKVITTKTDEELDCEVIEESLVAVPSLTNYLKKFAVSKASSAAAFVKDAYHDAADKRVGKRLGTSYKKRDAALVGALNVVKEGTVAVVGGVGIALKSGASKVFGWFSRSTKTAA
ncbi:MAG: hypothetical protein WCN27_00945 [Alphaproteobacteria bacterium]